MLSFATEFERIIEDTDRILWASFLAPAGASQATSGIQIRFPRKRNGEIRVSEQEARFALTGQLARSQLLYSVETPTSLPSSRTGDSGTSGLVDVTVYKPDGKSLWNIEFKAHAFSEDREARLSTHRGIEKLLREPAPAYWFHTFESVENSTLANAWRAFQADVQEVANHLSREKPAAKTLVFHACALRQRFSVEQELWIDPGGSKTGVALNVPSPAYVVSRSRLTSFETKDGWKFRRPEMF